MFIYCLYCATGRCRVIARLLEIRGVYRAFSPQIVQSKRLEGINLFKDRDLLPGYVFVYHPESLLDSDIFWGIDGVIRRVGRPQEEYLLQGSDREFAERLLDREGRVEAATLLREDSGLRLKDPVFNSTDAQIQQLDYKKQRAKISFRFQGEEHTVWLAVRDIQELNV